MTSAAIDKRLKSLDEILNNGRQKSEVELLCIQRQIQDLEYGHKRGLIWDEDEAQRAVQFLSLTNHWKGPYAGQPFIPEPWQDHCLTAPLFGWFIEGTRRQGGRRRFHKAGVEIPRKNGKTFWGGSIGVQGLVADDEAAPEVYSAATTREQARFVFDCSNRMLSDKLRKILNPNKHFIENQHNDGIFKPLSAETKGLYGLNIHRAIVDEFHAHPNRMVWDALLTSIIARRNPLIAWVTTAGFDRQSIWFEERQFCEKILDRASKGELDYDDSYFVYMARADEGDDWTDPVTHEKANPNYHILSKRYFETEVKKAKESPAAENSFKRMHLNMMTESEVRWMPMELWDDCSRLDPKDSTHVKDWEQDLLGRDCYAGLDLASTRDLTAWVLVFPWGDGHRVLVRSFAPEKASSKRAEYDKQSYAGWSQQGYVQLTKGSSTDYKQLQRVMDEDRRNYNIRKVALDPHNIPAFHSQLINAGWPQDLFLMFTQSTSNYNDPMQRLLESVLEGRLDHGNNPLLRWSVANLVAKQDDRGYIRPDKKNSQDKIDPAVAMIMGFALAIQKEEYVPTGRFYETHDLEVISI